jgi:antitoxin (DNA-binding transcriptional repressor) of toxin-antitoxin stability system
MRMIIGIRELRKNMTALEKGETVTITLRGRVIGTFIPCQQEDIPLAKEEAPKPQTMSFSERCKLAAQKQAKIGL